ncbi:MAG: hypothetical protein QXT50_03685 [Thermofilum sp.]
MSHTGRVASRSIIGFRTALLAVKSPAGTSAVPARELEAKEGWKPSDSEA